MAMRSIRGHLGESMSTSRSTNGKVHGSLQNVRELNIVIVDTNDPKHVMRLRIAIEHGGEDLVASGVIEVTDVPLQEVFRGLSDDGASPTVLVRHALPLQPAIRPNLVMVTDEIDEQDIRDESKEPLVIDRPRLENLLIDCTGRLGFDAGRIDRPLAPMESRRLQASLFLCLADTPLRLTLSATTGAATRLTRDLYASPGSDELAQLQGLREMLLVIVDAIPRHTGSAVTQVGPVDCMLHPGPPQCRGRVWASLNLGGDDALDLLCDAESDDVNLSEDDGLGDLDAFR